MTPNAPYKVFGRQQRRDDPHAELAGVQKAPRREVAGSLAPALQRVLWGFDAGGELDDRREVGRMRPADQRAGEIGTVQRASRRGVGAHQRALGALEDTIGSRRIAAGAEPAHPIRKVAALTAGLAHDVSILLGIGRHFGWQPRANTSITIMRAPQRGHGQASTRGVSAVISGGTCTSSTTSATAKSIWRQC